ncbi:SigE family RNA polymerase sigma factor [Thalassiella azotivora]
MTEHDFDAVYAASVHRLAGQLYLLTGDREEALECVQEAFERAWLRWDSVAAHEDPVAWVRTVAHRVAVSRWRRTRNAVRAWTRHGGGPRQHDGGTAVAADRVALVDALQELPAAQRTAIVLHHLYDLDVATVAAETHSSVSAVKSRLSRGRQALAERLGDVHLAGADPTADPGPAGARPPADRATGRPTDRPSTTPKGR